MGGGYQDEDGLIENILQSPAPSILSLEEVVKETQNNHKLDLFLVYYNPIHIKTIEIGLERTLKINPSLSVLQGENFCNMLKEHLYAFS